MVNINEISSAAVNGTLYSTISSLSTEELNFVEQAMKNLSGESASGRLEALEAVLNELKARNAAAVYSEHRLYH